MTTIYIENKPYQVRDGKNLLEACLSLGFNLPYFCWHPAMHSVGACRQCAVKQFRDENDTKGKIVMSCMTPVTEGMRISIDDAEAVSFRKSVIEWLMLNHPHDCPVCDEGGECHLQDMTVMTGHSYRRTRFKKRTFRNQHLGPFVNHEMNRCIECYRCIRFYCEYAGGRDFNVFASHHNVYFGRYEDGALENEFSGNLVEVCPTGVFTDKTLKRHYTRKWDLQTAPSVCVHCGVGCNTIPGERYGMLRRIRNRFNGSVNGYFLCDRGRYGYEFVNSEKRILTPFIHSRRKKEKRTAARQKALRLIRKKLSSGAALIGIGSPRASLEANFALRSLVGSDNFYLGLSETDYRLLREIIDVLQQGAARSPSLEEIRNSDAVFVLGEDLTNFAPVTALALRQSVRRKPIEDAVKRLRIPGWQSDAVREAIQNEKEPLFIAVTCRTKLDDAATGTYCAPPDDLARLGFAVASEIDETAPAVQGLSEELRILAKKIAGSLQSSSHPVVLSGTGSGSAALIHAAANVAAALCKKNIAALLSFVVPECNSLGLALMGGKSLGEAFKAAREHKTDAVILENDLYRRAGASETDEFLDAVGQVIVIDHTLNATAEKASILLPAGTFAESAGTLVNNEGRAQRFYKVISKPGEVQESWRWLSDIMAIAGNPSAARWVGLDDIIADLAQSLPQFRFIPDVAPSEGFRVAGLKIPRQPHRWSGRTAIPADITVHEPKPPDDPDSALSFSMEGYEGQPPPPLIQRFWAPGWNSVQSVNKFQSEVGGPLRGGDPGKRLIEPSSGISYFRDLPDSFTHEKGKVMILPAYHIFGSEELSVLSHGVAELSPGPYIGLNDNGISDSGAREGEEIEVIISVGKLYRLPMKRIPSLPDGIAVIPSGIPGMEGIILPAAGGLGSSTEEGKMK